jgi:flagellar protein FlaG
MMISSSTEAGKPVQDLTPQKRLVALARESVKPASSDISSAGAAAVTVHPAAVSKSSDDDTVQQAKALEEINHNLKISSIGLQFEFDKDANKMITKVIDVASGDVIRRIPSEEVIRMSKAIGELQDKMMAQNLPGQIASRANGLSGLLMKTSS